MRSLHCTTNSPLLSSQGSGYLHCNRLRTPLLELLRADASVPPSVEMRVHED